MQITVNLDALEEHQDYLRQQLRTSERLLAILKEQQSLDHDNYSFFQRHIQAIHDFCEVTHLRRKALQDAFDLLKESNHFLKEKLDEANQMMRY